MLLTVAEVGKQLKVSSSFVYRLVQSGQLAVVRVGNGQGCIRIDEVGRDGLDEELQIPLVPAVGRFGAMLFRPGEIQIEQQDERVTANLLTNRRCHQLMKLGFSLLFVIGQKMPSSCQGDEPSFASLPIPRLWRTCHLRNPSAASL